MKKVIALFGVMVFSASAFALNAVSSAEKDGGKREAAFEEYKDCAKKKVAFEEYVAGQTNQSFIAQNILINMADPMETMTDEEAKPLAACYAKFHVKGKRFVEFVRANAGIFPGDVSGKEEAELRAFADRVERLSIQAEMDRMVSQGNQSHTLQYILYNFVDPMVNMSDEEATSLAKAYKACKVGNVPLLQFIREHSGYLDGNVGDDYDKFVDRVSRLAK